MFALALALVAPSVSVADTTWWKAGIFAGLGGTEDADQAPGYDNNALQLNLAMVGEAGTLLVVRVGQFDFGDEALDGILEPEMRWATIGGEYRFRGRWFESGMYLALGGYQLDGFVGGLAEDQTAWGLSLGTTAEWRLSRHFSIDAELAGHWADFDEAQLFLVGLVGVSVHF